MNYILINIVTVRFLKIFIYTFGLYRYLTFLGHYFNETHFRTNRQHIHTYLHTHTYLKKSKNK